MNMLRFKAHFRVERLPPDLVFLLAEREQHTLCGYIYYQLAPLLNGQHDLPAIVEALSGSASLMQVQYAIERLKRKNYLEEIDSSLAVPDEQTRFWIAYGKRPEGSVSICTIGELDTAPLYALLEVAGIEIKDSGADFEVVLTDDILNPELELINRTATQPWMVVVPIGLTVWIGPVFEPHSKPCWECLAYRIRSNRPVESFLETRYSERNPLPSSALPSTISTAFSLTATQIALWLTGQHNLNNYVYTFDTLTMNGKWHFLVSHPTCSKCGNINIRTSLPVILSDRPKLWNGDSGARSMAAHETLEEYSHHVSPITGIVSRLTRVRSPEHIYLYASGHNKARSFQAWGNFKRNLRSESAGKGTNETQARTSALCEALERYSGVFQGDEPRITARWGELDDMIHPNKLLMFSDHQYDIRDEWNTHCPPHLTIAEPFDESRPIEWSPAWSLSAEAFRYIPTALCYYDYPLPADHLFCGADSNGCAAGNSLEDAILQGFLELVERDGIALWWYNRLQRPAWDLDAMSHPYIEQCRDYFFKTGRELWVLDLTADFGIPIAAAVSRSINSPTEDIVLGFGAHFDPHIAILRAVTELNQSLPAALPDEEGKYQSESPWEIQWWKTATISAHSFLAPQSFHQFSSLTSGIYMTDNLRNDVDLCTKLAQQHGIELLVLNQTREDIKLPVVRVIAPSLRHFWSRFAPGRLYDIPIQMGWLRYSLTESELNPLPMFM